MFSGSVVVFLGVQCKSKYSVVQAQYVLKNLMRDWSPEGAAERQESYGWLLEAVSEHVPVPQGANAIAPRVLVPGCGLARLPTELAGRGYHAVGNEFSFFMILTCSWVLNALLEPESVDIHPWVLSTSNQRSRKLQARRVAIPDDPAGHLLQRGGGKGHLGMVTGDFVPVFSDVEYHGSFACVATCFFIDTAHNIVEYIEVRFLLCLMAMPVTSKAH
jgi:carnosine N-methyltransferase